MSYADYLELERSTGLKHEFVDGQVWAMSGGTPSHSAITSNVNALLHVALRSSPSRPYSSDLKIRVFETGLASYSDVAVVCGPIEPHPEDANAVTNPSLLIEVLSPSTEAWDRGAKFAHYRRIPSLRHYVLADSVAQRVELYTRQDDETWTFSEHLPGVTFRLDTLDLELAVDEVFADLPA